MVGGVIAKLQTGAELAVAANQDDATSVEQQKGQPQAPCSTLILHCPKVTKPTRNSMLTG